MIVNIGQYIYQALSSINGLTVYPVIAAFDSASPTTPFAVYQRTSAEPSYTKSMWTGDIRHLYSITVVDSDFDASADLAQEAVNRLMALSYTQRQDIRFGQVIMTDITEDFTDGLFVQTLQFEINTQRI